MMTREEAAKWLEETIQDTDTYFSSCSEALQKELDEQKEVFLLALTALRPVSREQVERIWFREPYSRLETRQGDDGSIVYSAVNTCMACGHETPIGNFCPHCGAPMTNEAVQMVMERLEAMKDGKGD